MAMSSTKYNPESGFALKPWLPWTALALLLLLSLGLRSRYLWVEPFDYDEGHWLMFGALANAGYRPYSEAFVGIPPLALLTIQLGEKLFNATLAARYPMMLWSLPGVAALFLAFRPWQRLANLLAGLLAGLLLSFQIDYFQDSASIMAEVPAVSLAVVSLALAQQYPLNRKPIWLFLSGLVFALSLMLKIFVVFLPALIGLLIILAELRPSQDSVAQLPARLLGRGALWGLGAALPLAAFLIIYDPYPLYRDVFAFRLALRQVFLAQGVTPLTNITPVTQLLLNHKILLIGAVAGVAVGWRALRRDAWLWAGWFLLAVLTLIWHIPLRERYAVMAAPPLAALSALALTWGADRLTGWLASRQMPPALRHTAAALLWLGVLVWALSTPLRRAALPPAADTFPDLDLDAVEYVWENTTRTDCLVTDDQRFAFAAGRLVPPALSETSIARLSTQWLTVDEIVNHIEAYDCPMVIYADRRFAEYTPELYTRLRQIYFLEIDFEEDVTVFTGKRQDDGPPVLPLAASFGKSIVLTGFDFTPLPWRPGQLVRIAAYWTLSQPEANTYKIFLQLRDASGKVVLTADHFPYPAPDGSYLRLEPSVDNPARFSAEDVALYPKLGMLPTDAWEVGKIIREVTPLQLPARLRPGEYHLFVGLYDPASLARLPVQTNAGQTDELFVTAIQVAAAE